MPVEIIEELAIKNNPGQAVAASERISYTGYGFDNVKEALDAGIGIAAALAKPAYTRNADGTLTGYDDVRAALVAAGTGDSVIVNTPYTLIDVPTTSDTYLLASAAPGYFIFLENCELILTNDVQISGLQISVGGLGQTAFMGASKVLESVIDSFSIATNGSVNSVDSMLVGGVSGLGSLLLTGSSTLDKYAIDAFVLQGGLFYDERFVVTSPNGTRYRIDVSDAGVLSTTAL